MKLTDAQCSVITAGNANLLVGAGAGSGKTTTVVQKLCYLLGAAVTDRLGVAHTIAQPLMLADVAAITYTNQAAADLKRKLRAALTAAGKRDLATEVDAAKFGTIHGFCGELLRDHALRAGLPAAQRIIEEGEAIARTGECASRALHDAIAADDVPHLGELLTARQLRDVRVWVEHLAVDTDQLAQWNNNVSRLRNHERALLLLAQRTAVARTGQLRSEAVLDFDRMIVATRNLLRDDADVRHAVQRQLRVLIIDEFQDVDPAQRDIALLLAGVTAADPSPTRIVLVGDPKQSIYRFRRADVSLWNDMRRRFLDEGIGQVHELVDNFRSRKGILALVDTVIGPTLTEPIASSGVRQPFEVDYIPLKASSTGAAGDRCVEMICVAAKSDGKPQNADVVRAAEAQAVAGRILELSRQGCGFGDIAVLLASWGALDVYERALREAGIPTYALRGEGFWSTREILDCITALRAIRDPRDRSTLIGFLKGPFVGVRDDTLYALALAGGADGPYQALATVPHERTLLDRARALLDRFGALRDRMPLHELLQRLIEESGYLASIVIPGAAAQQAVANVRKLVRHASTTPQLSMGEFLREVDEQRARDDRVPQERLYREKTDVVTITSVHSAKGLEWNVVFWCDLVRDVAAPTDKLLRGRSLFLVKGEFDDDKGKDAEYEALKVEIAQEQMAESYRLWYVAATRPKERLVLSGIPLGEGGRGKGSPARMLKNRFFAETGTEAPLEITYGHEDGDEYHMMVRVVDALEEAGKVELERPATVEPESPLTVVRAPVGRTRLSATQLMSFAHDPKLWWWRYVFGFAPAEAGKHYPGGDNWRGLGMMVHDVLEQYGREACDIEELIDGAIFRQEGDDTDAPANRMAAYRARIRELVDAAVGHPAWKEIARHPTARRELAFTRVLLDGGTIEGAFDIAAVEDGVVRVLDVKTGSGAMGAELADRYAIQAAVYLDAARMITGNDEARFALLAAGNGELVAVDPNRLAIDQLVRALRA